MSSSGCKYPTINISKCINCQQCHRVCNNRKANTHHRQNAYFCYSNHDNIRVQSASGGIFSEIAARIIDNSGVVFGVAWNDNNEAVYTSARTHNELSPLRRSKYVHSDVNLSYRQAEEELQKGQPVLFSGTPCIIAGLRAYLGKEYDNLLCVDIICHGVPGQGIWNSYLQTLSEQHNSPITNITHRSGEWHEERINYNYNYNYINKATGSIEEVTGRFDDASYTKGFLDDNILMDSCYRCEFRGIHSVSDITIGDAWGYAKIMNKKGSTKGESLAIINSDKGRKFFDKLTALNLITITKEIDIDTIKDINPALFTSPCYGSKYLTFRNLYTQGLKKEALSQLLLPDRDKVYDDLKNKWLEDIFCKRNTLSSFIKDAHISNVVIYGTGSLGELLAKYIHNNESSVNIAYCIDAKPVSFNGLSVDSYSSSQLEHIPDKDKVDIIIITPIHAKVAIKNMLAKYYNCTIISLDEIIV